tara:strand:- start:15941 stop:16102 length:162 start_codon:yes stop_codon:yes gene_type:complete
MYETLEEIIEAAREYTQEGKLSNYLDVRVAEFLIKEAYWLAERKERQGAKGDS